MTEAASPTGKKKHGWVPWVVVPALTALGLGLMATDFQGGDEKMLVTQCQQVARNNALAPTTVQFADDVRLTPQAPGLWTITGTMDSMNVFGGHAADPAHVRGNQIRRRYALRQAPTVWGEQNPGAWLQVPGFCYRGQGLLRRYTRRPP